MSTEEHNALDAISKQLKLITKWWPTVIILCGIISASAVATSVWDNKVAKKSDIESVVTQGAKLSKQVSELADLMKDVKTVATTDKSYLNKRIDSTVKVVNSLKKRYEHLTAGYVTQTRDRNGKITTHNDN